MRSTTGFVFCSLLITVGTLLLFLDSNSQRRLTLRHSTSQRRSLYNWSRSSGSSSSSSSSYNRSSNSRYSSNNSGSSSGSSSSSSSASDSDGDSSSSSSSSSSNSGNNYANYNDNASNNEANYDNQDYDNSNYIWQNDDIDYSKTDDASYYKSNKNYQANGSNYNGRGQWGGQSVQHTDDVEPEVTVYGEDDTEHWTVFSKFGTLSAKETAALSVLLALFSLCLLFLLGCGCSIVDICQLYICCGIFRHKDVNTSTDPVVDGFVKLGDY